MQKNIHVNQILPSDAHTWTIPKKEKKEERKKKNQNLMQVVQV